MTPPQDSRYFFAIGDDLEQEQARLKMLESLFDPTTRERLLKLGLAEGWRCLEVGAGAGSITRWLADQVGTAGHVVAAELDTRLLQDLKATNIEVRRCDIRVDRIEAASYNLVHCRAVLCHLADPLRAARRLVASLRPGGWLLAEDPDFTGMMAVTREHPDAAIFDVFVRKSIEFQWATADYNAIFGRSLPQMVRQLGLVSTGNEVDGSVVWGGEPRAQLYLEGRRRARQAYLDGGVVTPEEFARVERVLTDPSFAYMEWAWVAAWGQR